jgi:hypothetical protein
MSATFSLCFSIFVPPPPPFGVTGDLDKEERRVGGRGKDLGAGLRDAAAGSTSDQCKEGFSATLSPPIFDKTEVTRELHSSHKVRY